jgi:hypothetical protein
MLTSKVCRLSWIEIAMHHGIQVIWRNAVVVVFSSDTIVVKVMMSSWSLFTSHSCTECHWCESVSSSNCHLLNLARGEVRSTWALSVHSHSLGGWRSCIKVDAASTQTSIVVIVLLMRISSIHVWRTSKLLVSSSIELCCLARLSILDPMYAWTR